MGRPNFTQYGRLMSEQCTRAPLHGFRFVVVLF